MRRENGSSKSGNEIIVKGKEGEEDWKKDGKIQ